ncbi:MAG: HDOD domain-containing protein, partial [Ferrimonas sp.]
MANERALLVQLIDKINHDQVMLPSLPQVAMAVLELAQQSTCTLPQLANEISKDPGLSAGMIKRANQMNAERVNKACTVLSALMQLGLEHALEAAIEAADNQLFYAEQPWVGEQFEQLQNSNWTLVSTALAILACEHSRGHLLNLNADTLKLACQVHNIGRLPVLVQVDQQPHLFSDKAELSACLTRLQGPLGGVLLTQYQFP